MRAYLSLRRALHVLILQRYLQQEHALCHRRHLSHQIPFAHRGEASYQSLLDTQSLLHIITGFSIVMKLFSLLNRFNVEGSDREQILILSFSLVAAGMFFLMITNYIVNKENRAFVAYLNLKVEQYTAQHRRNIQSIPPEDNEEV